MAPARATGLLIQIEEGEVVLVETEEMAEFVEVGGTDLFGKDFRIAFREIPQVIQIENNPRWRIRGMGIGLKATGAFEEAQEVGFETLVQHRLVWHGLVKGDDRFRGGAEFGRQAGADALHAGCGQGMEIGFQGFRLGLGLGLRKTGKVRMGQKSS